VRRIADRVPPCFQRKVDREVATLHAQAFLEKHRPGLESASLMSRGERREKPCQLISSESIQMWIELLVRGHVTSKIAGGGTLQRKRPMYPFYADKDLFSSSGFQRRL